MSSQCFSICLRTNWAQCFNKMHVPTHNKDSYVTLTRKKKNGKRRSYPDWKSQRVKTTVEWSGFSFPFHASVHFCLHPNYVNYIDFFLLLLLTEQIEHIIISNDSHVRINCLYFPHFRQSELGCASAMGVVLSLKGVWTNVFFGRVASTWMSAPSISQQNTAL